MRIYASATMLPSLRSLILPGILIETAVLSTLELVEIVYQNLPLDHAPLWDELVAGGAEIAEGLHKFWLLVVGSCIRLSTYTLIAFYLHSAS
jgi:hypothetical protein